jgi:ribonuclease BN (tRNA processing enzyme)
VKAFLVPHGSWDQAFGYRFETPDRTIVLSGDTGPTDAVGKACDGCDIMLHEVYSETSLASRTAEWQKYFHAFHTSPRELAAEAVKGKPGVLVLYHQMYWPPTTDEQALTEVKAAYPGKVIWARDLDVY